MIRWITKDLGTGAYEKCRTVSEVALLDVRDLVDKAGNTVSEVKNKIEQAVVLLEKGRKVLICCDAGLSRSNAVAAGVMCVLTNSSFYQAVRRVVVETGESSIKVEMLAVVRDAVTAIRELNVEQHRLAESRKVLITGGTGFLGKVLATHLESRHGIVMASGRRHLDLLRDAVEVDLMVQERGVTDILHLATPRVENTNRAVGESITMLRNVLDVCQVNSIKLFYVSSFQVFSGYSSSTQFLVTEETPPKPKSLKGKSKHLCEELIRKEAELDNLEYVIIRTSSVYGLSGTKPKFLWNFIDKARNGEDIYLHKFQNGYATLDLLHIRDFCKAIDLLLQYSVKGIIHLANGRPITTMDLAEMIRRIIENEVEIGDRHIDSSVMNIRIQIDKAKDILNWSPEIDIHSGIQELIKSNKGGISNG
jgi:UDP-glucuronate decarboxylase